MSDYTPTADDRYEPELGQFAFSGSPWQEYEAYWATGGLGHIAEVICEARGEKPGPYGWDNLLTDNSGAEPFENDVFAMRAYCWCDNDRPGHENGCPPNFQYKPSSLVINWYKHANRGVSANQERPPTRLWLAIIVACIESIAAANGDTP